MGVRDGQDGSGRVPGSAGALGRGEQRAGEEGGEGAGRGDAQGVLRHRDRQRGGGARGDRAVRQGGAEDGGEFPRALHGGEGHGRKRQAAALQGLRVPPHHPQLHDPGGRHHARQRPRRGIHLRG